MMRYLFMAFVMLSGPAAAQMGLEDLFGHWDGRGSLSSADAPARALRCRLSIAPEDALVKVNARCATADGARSTSFALLALESGEVVTVPEQSAAEGAAESTILRGVFSSNALILTDGQDAKGIRLVFQFLEGDILRFGTTAYPNDVRTQAVVDLKARPAN